MVLPRPSEPAGPTSKYSRPEFWLWEVERLLDAAFHREVAQVLYCHTTEGQRLHRPLQLQTSTYLGSNCGGFPNRRQAEPFSQMLKLSSFQLTFV
jgi:hypothetical protein